jgi:hypothetical protein
MVDMVNSSKLQLANLCTGAVPLPVPVAGPAPVLNCANKCAWKGFPKYRYRIMLREIAEHAAVLAAAQQHEVAPGKAAFKDEPSARGFINLVIYL